MEFSCNQNRDYAINSTEDEQKCSCAKTYLIAFVFKLFKGAEYFRYFQTFSKHSNAVFICLTLAKEI